MMPRLGPGCVVALVGAESTGKTELALALAERLRQRGIAAEAVPEVLRGWCEREGRTPRADEQAAIAEAQARRIAEAAARGVAVADTTALVTAVYSDLLFRDRSLYPRALDDHRGYAITLLTGLDLPWVADGMMRDGPHVREPVDALVRNALSGAGLPYMVVHGQGPQRLASAWQALVAASEREAPVGRAREGTGRPWSCDKCSDPACEHRLFTDLLARRS